ncbi:MAG: CapA family protein [Eubacterium sp.]|nr:CapA family protein [Eubacterium sp.]
MKKFLCVLLLLLGCAATGFGGYWLAVHKLTAPTEDATVVSQVTPLPVTSGTSVSPAVSGGATEDDELEPDITEITFAACGDNLINSQLYGQAKARADGGSYDFSFCYEKVAAFFKRTDMNWMNQETLVTDTLPPSTYPCFSSPGDVVRNLYDINFRIFNLSTNHTYDQKAEGLAESVEFWKSMPDDTVTSGVVKNNKYDKIAIKEVDGVKFAFLSYTYGTNGLTVPSDSKYRVIYLSETDVIKKQVKLARKKADVVVVSCHWGNEDRHEVTESQRALAKQLTGWGADLIIGTHPHVVQTAEWVKSKGRKAFCAYSLGNFISGQDKSDNLIGAVLSLTFEVKEDMLNDTFTVSIKKPKLLPTVTDYRPGHQDIRVYWLKHYTRKLADTHGVRSAGGGSFNYDYIFDVLKKNINKKYLKLPKKK